MASAQDVTHEIKNDLILITSKKCTEGEDIGIISRRLIGNIEKFEEDSSILGRVLPGFVTILTDASGKLLTQPASDGNGLLDCFSRVYYTFDKVFGWKKVVTLLKVDLDILHVIIESLQQVESHSWYVDYFLLSWLYVILLSPFHFEKGNVDRHVLQLLDTRGFAKNNLYSGLVSNIIAEVCYKNKSLLKLPIGESLSTAQLLSLNYFLKRIISNNLAAADTSFLNENKAYLEYTIREIQIRWSNGDVSDDEQFALCMTKIMPKFFYVELYYENWSELEHIISWYLLNLDSQFTEVRYAHAHSFKKVVAIIATYMDVAIAAQLTERIVNDTEVLVNHPDSIDVDKFHSYLILIAEFMDHVINYLPAKYIRKIVVDILPIAFNFQVVNHLNLVSQKGNQIKDTANFVCWSLVRNRRLQSLIRQDSDICQSIFPKIFVPLLVNSLFDKDFIVRKSSNAALQEFLGRISVFGSDSGLILENTVVMKLLELKYSDLNISYRGNLTLLTEIFENNERWLSDVLQWFVEFNIMKNLDLKMVKLSINTIGTILNNSKKDNVNDIVSNLIAKINTTQKASPLDNARLLYLCVNVEATLELNETELYVLGENVRNSRFNSSRGNEEYFKDLTILAYWNFCMHSDERPILFHTGNIDFLFDEVVRGLPTKETSDWFNDISCVFNSIVHMISNNDNKLCFDSDSSVVRFWNLFNRFFNFNNELVCSSVPMLQSNDFIRKIYVHRETLTCQAKAAILSTINNDKTGDIINKIFSAESCSLSSKFTELLRFFLQDHTITDQGDVGRLVRYQACLLLQKHIGRFDDKERHRLCLEILFLLAEPSQEISNVCLGILQQEVFKNVEIDHQDSCHDLKILKMKDIYLGQCNLSILKLKESNVTYWKHFALRAGAIHSTDAQIQMAVDSFVEWYRGKSESSDDQVRIFHELIIAIPSASVIVQEKKESGTSNSVKDAVTLLNFISRVISTRVHLHTSNWDGILAKIHNLLILKGSEILKSTIVRFLPHLAAAFITVTEDNIISEYVNRIISELVGVMGRLGNSDNIPMRTMIIRGLVQIYLECGKQGDINRLTPLTRSSIFEEPLEPTNYYIDI